MEALIPNTTTKNGALVVDRAAMIDAAIEFRSNPTWRKLQALMDLKDFEFTFEYANSKIEIEEEEFIGAIPVFEKLGLIAKSGNSYTTVTTDLVLPVLEDDPKDRPLQLESHSTFMNDLSGLLSPERKSRWVSGFLVSDEETMREFKNRMIDLFIEFDKKSKDLVKPDGLYAVAFTATDIINPEGGL